MPVQYKETPGDSRGSLLAYQRAMLRFAEKVNQHEALIDRMFSDDMIVTGATVRYPMDEGDEYLIVMRARNMGSPVVCFHGAATLLEAWEGLLNRLQNKSIMWKADKYAKD